MLSRFGIALLLGLLMPLSGCLYHVQHRLPVDATFGSVRSAPVLRTPFEVTDTKRYLLKGLVPWSFSSDTPQNTLEAAPGRRIERLEIRTEFKPLDWLLSALPYASYLLSQRTIEVRGVYVDPVPATADAQPIGFPEN